MRKPNSGIGWSLGLYIYVFVVIVLAALAGCSGATRKELPVPIQFSLRATPNANPSVSGRPSPVVVSIYELRNSAGFLAADFMSLIRDDRAALGEDRLARQEYVLQPGETRLVRRRSDLSTRFIGVVAGYRDMEGSVWRAIAAIPAPNQAGMLWSGSASPERRLLITIDQRAITVVEEAGEGERQLQ
jgi:type VI secretion system protein VasD